MTTPPLPPGFVLEDDAPPLPPGFVIEQDDRVWDQPRQIVQGTLPARYRAAGIDPDVDPNAGIGRGRKIIEGVGASIDASMQGLKQAGTSAAEYFARSNPSIVPSGARDGLQGMMAQQQAAEVERRRVNSQMDGWGKGGQVLGTVGQIVGPGVALRGRSAAASLLPRTIKGNAAQGAVFGGVQPTVSTQERVGNATFGATAGGAGAAIPRLLGSTYRGLSGLSPAVSQAAQTRQAAGVLNQFAADPAALRSGAMSPQVIVPGSLPTLAEATGDVGLAGLQRTLANTPEFGNELFRRQASNNLARVRAIEGGFGGANASAADALTKARDLDARQILRPIDKLPMSSLDKVITGVNRLGDKFQAAPAVRDAMAAVKAELPNIRTVGDAHAVRQYIGQLIGGQVEGKAGAKLAKSQLMTVQGLLDREMRAAYPEWGKFLQNYKGASRQIGQVNVGETLLEKGPNVRAAGDVPILSPAKFAGAAADMDRTVANATNFRRATADKVLTPAQRATVDAVRRDLERYSRASVDGKAIGSNTVQNAIGGNSFQSAVGPVGAAMVEPVSGVAMMALNQMRAKYGERVASLVQEAMIDPARAAEILASVPSGQRGEVVRRVAPLLARASAVVGATSPALTE